MLTEEMRKEIEEEMGRVAHKQSVCIEALKVVQRHEGWVSDERLHDLAQFLDMTLDELDSVATFYNLIFRKPVGKHVILLCDSISCWVTGYEDVRQHLKKRLNIDFGETTADGQFTLLPIVCLGLCEQAPAMMVDRTVHGNLTAEEVDRILDQYQKDDR